MDSYKILVVPAWFNHQNKQDGIFIHQFCESLQNNNQQVTLLYVKIFSFRYFWKYLQEIKFVYKSNFKIIVVKKITFPFKNAIESFKYSIVKKVNKRLSKEKFDVIHIQSVCNNITPLIAKSISDEFKKPYVITEHYSSYKEAGDVLFSPYLTGNEVREIVKGASYRMGVSKYACGIFENYFKTNFNPFPNFVNEKYINTPLKINTDSNKEFIFLCIAALEKHKGQLILLDAFKNSFSGNSNIYLHLVGTGSQEIELKKKAEQLNLTKQVIFLGSKGADELIKIIDAANVIVSASSYETFGLTLVEGFLRGKPCVSTASGGPTELVKNSNGILCEKENINQLQSTLQNMYTNYASFNSEVIRENAVNDFSSKQLTIKLTEIYKTVLIKR